MYRLGILFGVLVGMSVANPAAFAYFPPANVVPSLNTPPDPFQVPGLGGLGEPEANAPDKVPAVSTPEPTTLVSALAGIALIAVIGLRKRLVQQLA